MVPPQFFKLIFVVENNVINNVSQNSTYNSILDLRGACRLKHYQNLTL